MCHNSLFFYHHRSLMMNHKLGRHQLLVMKMIVESYSKHFTLKGYVKKGEQKKFIHDLERGLKANNIRRGVKNLRNIIKNKNFRRELARIFTRKSIGKLHIKMLLNQNNILNFNIFSGIQTTFIFWNQAVPNDGSQDYIIIPEDVDHVPKEDHVNLDESSLSIIELSDDGNEDIPECSRKSMEVHEGPLDKTLSNLSNISSSEAFIPVNKPLPYKPGELDDTVVDEEQEVPTSSVPEVDSRYTFCYPRIFQEVPPHSSPLDRLKVTNYEFVTIRKHQKKCLK